MLTAMKRVTRLEVAQREDAVREMRGQGKTFSEIAKKFGWQMEYVRKLHARAQRKLKHKIKENK